MIQSPEARLSHRVVRSGIWVFALRITERSFYFIRLIILARMLSPHDFGLLGIAMLAMLTLENFSQPGFEAALIQKKKDVGPYLDTAWTVGIIRGVLLFSILYFISPYVAGFFETPEAKPVIRVLGLSFLIQALTNIGVIFFKKDLEFNKQFTFQITGTLVDFFLTVSAAILLRSVWALVFGLIAGNIARLITSYIVHPYRPQLSLDLGKAKDLFGFGKWVLGSSIIVFLLTQGDDIIVGKMLGATALGFYQMAYRIANLPTTEITNVISQVTFPAFSILQNDIPRLKETYLKVLQFVALVSFPAGVLIFVLAADFTKIFLGDKWMASVPAMQVLSIYGLIGVINGSFGPVLRGAGRPHVVTSGSMVQLVLLIVVIFPLTDNFGLTGTALAVFFPSCFVMIYLAKKVMDILQCNAFDLLKPIIPFFISSLAVFIFTFLLKNAVDAIYLRFIFLLATGIVIYLGSILLIKTIFKIDLWTICRAVWIEIKK